MIDPHVHLRDWAQAEKETLSHGIRLAAESAIDAVFDMPNTDPPLTDPDTVRRRLSEAEEIVADLETSFRYGVFCGAVPDRQALERLVELYHGERLGRNGRQVGIVGFKLYAGPSTGSLAAEEFDAQRDVYAALSALEYGGVICVHAEKSRLFLRTPEGNLDWDPSRPQTYASARPPKAEAASVRDQIVAAEEADFAGTLHIAHVSVPEVVEIIEEARGRVGFRISCEATPHHLLLSEQALSGPGGILWKTNPPLRPEALRTELYRMLTAGRIDFVASDHAPHTRADKLERYASGVPGIAVMHAFRTRLRDEGVDERLLARLFHDGAEEIYGVDIPESAVVTRADGRFDYPTNPYSLDII
jgi:dihydroorotase